MAGRREENLSPQHVPEVIKLGFDELEAYAYMAGGEPILRIEYKLLVIRLPLYAVRWDFIGYLRKLGAQIISRKKREITFTYEALGVEVKFRGGIIHRYGDNVYLAFVPVN